MEALLAETVGKLGPNGVMAMILAYGLLCFSAIVGAGPLLKHISRER